MTNLLMGIPGVGQAYPGLHICALVSGPAERDRLLVQFLQEGLRHGDQCVCLIDGLDSTNVRERAFRPGVPGDTVRTGRLDLYAAPDEYLHSGALSPQQMITALVPPAAAPGDLGRPLLRAAGQVRTDPSQRSSAPAIAAHESAVTRIMAEVPSLFLCLYDTRRIGVDTLVEVLKAHSRVVLDGAVLYNPHSVTPADPSEPDRASPAPGALVAHGAAGDPWRSLTDAEVRIAELVGAGMTNRATAGELIVSPHTVDAHLKHIYQKLGIHSRAELAVLSFRHGFPGS